MKTILITGANGMIGAYLTFYLSKNGHKVIATGRKDHSKFFYENDIIYETLDVTKKSDFKKIDKYNIDGVVHLAGAMPASMKGYKPELYFDSIIKGTFNILEYMRTHDVNRIIFPQSHADSKYLAERVDKIEPDIARIPPYTGDHSIYSICKNAAVDLVEHYYHTYGIKRFIIRMGTIYGYHPNSYYYVNGVKNEIGYRKIIRNAIEGKDLEVWGNPEKRVEVTDIYDFCKLIENCLSARVDGGIYNEGNGIGVSIKERIEGIAKIFGTPNTKIISRLDMPDTQHFIHNIDSVKKDIGYIPDTPYIEHLVRYKKDMEDDKFMNLWGCRGDYE